MTDKCSCEAHLAQIRALKEEKAWGEGSLETMRCAFELQRKKRRKAEAKLAGVMKRKVLVDEGEHLMRIRANDELQEEIKIQEELVKRMRVFIQAEADESCYAPHQCPDSYSSATGCPSCQARALLAELEGK